MSRAGRRLRVLAAVGALSALLLSGCGTRAPAEDHSIAAGGTSGIYYSFGEQLAEVLTRELGDTYTVAETEGSVENLRRIAEGTALLGFAQSDAAAAAIGGTGAFDEPLPIRAMARLYDEYVHVVVHADSEIHEIADFQGQPVSLGARNSGVNVVATRVLDAAGVELAAVLDHELALDASIEALRERRIEGFFWVGGLPTPGITQLAEDTPIRLLSMHPETFAALSARHANVYRLAELPPGAYGQEETATTMTVPNYLVVAEDAPDGLVAEILAALFAQRAEIAREVPAAALLDRRQAIFTGDVELHPGATRYYTDTRR